MDRERPGTVVGGAPGPGAVVAWWGSSGLDFGVVTAEEGERLRMVVRRGKLQRIPTQRVAFGLGLRVDPLGDSLEARMAMAGRLAEIVEPIRERAAEADVPTLWSIVADGDEAMGPHTVGELAELALEQATPLACAALILALEIDGVHFVRRGDEFLARTAGAVEEILHQRARVAQRDAEAGTLFAALAAASRGEGFAASSSATEQRYLEALEQVAIHEEAAGEPARGLAGEALQAAGVRHDKLHEGAFRLLRRIGRFASDDENLLVPRYGLRAEFPEGVLDHASRRAAGGFEVSGRRDLGRLVAFSIDGPSTSEIDDLLSLEVEPDGTFRLGVHIADPAAFVEIDDPVDREAAARGLTHYMPDVRLPMLPASLSEGAASLVPGEPRPALSFLALLTPEGDVRRYEIVRSVVRSSARLDYDEADRIIRCGASPLTETLRRLATVGEARAMARVRSGALRILTDEVEVHVDPTGRPTLERLDGRSPSRQAVSEAMVLAGELAARFCIDGSVPAVFRRQAPAELLPPFPAEGIQDPVLARRIRRQLRRAEVGLEPAPHASLGLEAYVQASSPIRRFQDLALHRQIVAVLAGREPAYDAPTLRRIASATDRLDAEARRAERAAEAYWLLRYLEGRVGHVLEATVVEVQPRLVLLLDETLTEHVHHGLAGSLPGARVTVRVERVNPRAGLLSLAPER